MLTFQEIEEIAEGKHLVVRARLQGKEISGLLEIRGTQTEARISVPRGSDFGASGNGWFDLPVTGTDGTKLLFHNVLLTLRTSTIRSKRESVHLFPNTVVFRADCLAPDNKVSQVQFTTQRMRSFFNYPNINSLTLTADSADQLDLLQQIQSQKSSSRRRTNLTSHGEFKPLGLFVVHSVPSPIDFSIAGRRYQVDISVGWNRGAGSLNIQSRPIARILFKEPVSIDKSLQYVWEWRRFFSQVAYAELPLEGVWARGTSSSRKGFASLYLPNLRMAKAADSEPHFGPPPFSLWDERSRLAEVMRDWLIKEEQRKRFRISLNHVLARRSKVDSFSDIVTLCSAIESLTELEQKSALSGDDLNILVDGAIKAASDAHLKVDAGRIRGVLSLLQHQSLPQSIKALLRFVSPPLTRKHKDVLLKTVLELRRVGAHGNAYSELTAPRLSLALDALTAVCVLFDLKTSGVSVAEDDDARTLEAESVALRACDELIRLDELPK
jgi:hypothetical protein